VVRLRTVVIVSYCQFRFSLRKGLHGLGAVALRQITLNVSNRADQPAQRWA